MKRKLFPKKLITTISTITLSIALLFTSSSVLPTLGATNTNPTINRLSGNDRYDTSSQIAKQGWSNGSDSCILVYGGNYPDALSATPLAKKLNAPILLTENTSLTPITKQTIVDLNVKNVTIIGGTGVLSSAIDTELQSMNINVTRIFGQTQYDTAIEIAKQFPSPNELIVCTGEEFSDSLSISPVASIKQIPIILVPSDNMPSSVKNYINTNSANITKSYIIGNTDIINDNVANQFPNVEKISGATKYDRNIAINQKFNNQFNSNNICLATGEQFPDALSGSSYASKISSPIILVNNATPNGTKNYYQQRLTNTDNVIVFGGTAVVPDSVIQGLGNISSTDTNVNVPITPIAPIAPIDIDNTNIVNNSNNTTNSNNNNTTTIINNGSSSIDTSTGCIKGSVTWQYNKFIGTKADVGAKIALIPKNLNKNSDNPVFSLTLSQIPQGQNGIYTAKANGYGEYEIADVPVGSYYLLISSVNTNNNMTISSIDQQILSNLLSSMDWKFIQPTLKIHKYNLIKVQIEGGKTLTESYDFGNTYI